MGGFALMNMWKSFTHGLVTLACVAVGWLLGSPFLGATTGMAFYVGREVAQHEAKTAGSALRGFYVHHWSRQTWFDLIFPALVATAIWTLP
jgi:hypothetical protein